MDQRAIVLRGAWLDDLYPLTRLDWHRKNNIHCCIKWGKAASRLMIPFHHLAAAEHGMAWAPSSTGQPCQDLSRPGTCIFWTTILEECSCTPLLCPLLLVQDGQTGTGGVLVTAEPAIAELVPSMAVLLMPSFYCRDLWWKEIRVLKKNLEKIRMDGSTKIISVTAGQWFLKQTRPVNCKE